MYNCHACGAAGATYHIGRARLCEACLEPVKAEIESRRKRYPNTVPSASGIAREMYCKRHNCHARLVVEDVPDSFMRSLRATAAARSESMRDVVLDLIAGNR